MFGKPEWFVTKTSGWALKPAHWQGWIYTLTWAFVVVGPFLFLALRSQFLEAGVWITTAMAGFTWDTRDILRQMKQRTEVEEFFYIGENGGHEAETENHELRVKT
jgi:hypothetical protein